jgi:DNA processing protein
LEKRETLLGFAETDFLSVPRISQLKNHFGSLESAWNYTDQKEFIAAGVSQRSVASFLEKRQKADPEKMDKKNPIRKCQNGLWEDESYPEVLKTIDSPPVFLFVRGHLKSDDALSISVVGTRRVSVNGRQMTESIVPELVNAGLTITSGLARGVDAIAHKATVQSGGRTIAVLGNGIDAIYPPENRVLGEKIIESGGAVISEFCPGTPPNAFHFPRRNRIVAALSLGTLVIEGAEKSGSLITAQFALEQGKEVFAVPGSPAVKMSEGPNRLIQRGEAKLILSAEDILSELSLPTIKSQQSIQKSLPADPIQKAVYELLEEEPLLFDEILRKSEYVSAEVSATLTILEMKGFALSFGGNRWAKKL